MYLPSGKQFSGSMSSSAISEYSSSSSPGFRRSIVLPSDRLMSSLWKPSEPISLLIASVTLLNDGSYKTLVLRGKNTSDVWQALVLLLLLYSQSWISCCILNKQFLLKSTKYTWVLEWASFKLTDYTSTGCPVRQSSVLLRFFWHINWCMIINYCVIK